MSSRPESFVRNCLLVAKEPYNPEYFMFRQNDDGSITAHLDGYAIIPIERYTALGGAAGEPIEVGGGNV